MVPQGIRNSLLWLKNVSNGVNILQALSSKGGKAPEAHHAQNVLDESRDGFMFVHVRVAATDSGTGYEPDHVGDATSHTAHRAPSGRCERRRPGRTRRPVARREGVS